MGPWVFYLSDMSQVHDEKAEKGGGGISAQFSGIIIFSLELYLGDQLCSKCTKKVLSVTRLMRYRPIKIIS